MNSEPQRNKLNMPLHPVLMDYIMHEYPQTGPIIVSTVEYTIKESRNHYMDVMRALEPLLRENTKPFVDKLFMFRKRMCRDGPSCNKYFCLFAHNDEELVGTRRPSLSEPVSKRPKLENAEVLLSEVSEEKFTIEDLKDHCQKYGVINTVKKVGRGRYIVFFEDLESAKRMVSSDDVVLDDADIKVQLNPHSGNAKVTELSCLFDDQKDLLDLLTQMFDSKLFEELKEISEKIKENVLSAEPKRTSELGSPQYKQDESIPDVESSLYYNMFAK